MSTLFLLLRLVAAGLAAAPSPPDVPHYDLRLELDPAARHLRVAGTLALPPSADTVAAFFLHRQLDVERFGGGFRVDGTDQGVRYLPEAVRVVTEGAAGDTVWAARPGRVVAFAYEGTVSEWPEWSANVVGPGWVEMGLYLPWFPYHPALRPFTYSVEVVAPAGYRVFVPGEATPVTAGATRFRVEAPTNDIVVVAARGLRVREVRAGGGALRFAGVRLADATVDSLLSDVGRARTRFTDWFGPVEGSLAIVASEREKGGGYARLGGLFLAGLDDEAYLANRTGYLRYLGHELAHLWWHRADTNGWEDWLNEGLAEVSALLAVREEAGVPEFERRLDLKREEAAGTPAIHGFDRNGDPAAEAVLYAKAPVLLAELEGRMGTGRFLGLLRQLHHEGASTTDDFLRALERSEGPELRRWFEERLRTK